MRLLKALLITSFITIAIAGVIVLTTLYPIIVGPITLLVLFVFCVGVIYNDLS
jgi:hypothetical protein